MKQKDYITAENKMNELLAIVTQKGGFDKLTNSESEQLDKYTQIVNEYETQNFIIPMPKNLQGIIELKMYENKLKQKDLAKMLRVTETKLSEIMNMKRKPNVAFLKEVHKVLNVDGNLLLEIV